jgi:hypothetical protein
MTRDFPAARFQQWIGQYTRNTRLFHGIEHLLDMTAEDKTLTARGNAYAVIGSFFHDAEYPSIGEKMTEVSERYLRKYIRTEDDGKGGLNHFVRSDLNESDRITKILLKTFGVKPGEQLSPFGCLNEFYSAVAAAEEMKRLDCDEKLILGVIVNIQATVPFGQDKDRFNIIRARAVEVNKDLGLGLTKPDVDTIMMAAVKTANLDVLGFLGGLDPLDPSARPSINSVLETIAGGDRLRPEEVRALMLRGAPQSERHFPLDDFLMARIKGAGLYLGVIPGDHEQKTIPNLFHSVTLSDGTIYPPKEWTEKANKLAYENTQPVKVAECARMLSVSAIWAISKLSGNEELGPDKIRLQDLVSGSDNRIEETDLPESSSSVRRLADACLSGRHETDYDIKRSPIAQLIIREVDETKVLELATKLIGVARSRGENPEEKAKQILEVLGEAIPKTMLETRSQMEASLTENGKGALATVISRVNIPTGHAHD